MTHALIRPLRRVLLRLFVWIRNSVFLGFMTDLFRVLYPLRFVCLMLAVGAFSLLTFEQLSEILRIMMEEDFWLARGVFLVAFIGWAYATWYSARFTLDATCLYTAPRPGNQRRVNCSHRRLVFMMAFIPRLLGLCCHVIILIAFIQIRFFSKELLIYSILTVLYLAYVFFRAESNRPPYAHWTELMNYEKLCQRFDPFTIYGWKNLNATEHRLIRVTLWTSGVLFTLFLCTPRRWQIAFFDATTLMAAAEESVHLFNALILLLLSLFVWLTLGMYLQWLVRQLYIRLFSVLLVLSVLFSFFNNNHSIRTTDTPVVRPTLPVHFQNWYTLKAALWRQQHADTVPMPVFIIAAEGGGSRAAYWTGMALHRLFQQHPEAYNYTFAISSVSGGSVGAAMYLAMRQHRDSLSTEDVLHLKRILSKDFLTPVTAALLYPDLTQKFLPFPISAFDRARWLEDTWAKTYEQNRGQPTLDNGFLTIWKTHPYAVPALFLNCTRVETGQKVLVSNLYAGSDAIFKDAEDLFQVTGRDIPLKTAISMSSRFPLVTPPAYVQDSSGNAWGNVVDGGYFENTGLGTATEIYLFLQNAVRTSSLPIRIRPVIISIVNDDYRTNETSVLRFIYELRTPVSAFYNAWGRRSVGTNFIARYLIGDQDFMNISLNREAAEVPLNWYLSKTSVDSMQAQLNRSSFSELRNWLK